MRSLHLLSLLLQYPTTALQSVCEEVGERLAVDPALPKDTVARLHPLLNRLASSDIYEAQETYVELFDRGRAHSLHLFEHVHGESRDRGQAMVDLRQRYTDAGLIETGNELPDYLPLFLDYCSTLAEADARDALAEPGVVLVALAGRLAERGSDYAPVLALLCDIAGVDMDEEAQKALSPADDPDDLEALDQQWAEEEVRFTADAAPNPNDGCPRVGDMLERMRNPTPAMPLTRN